MEDLIQEFINKRIWAVVGVSLDPKKYGHRIFNELRKAGYIVYGINPRGGEIQGEKLYRSLEELPQKPEVVNLVVPPEIAQQIVRKCAQLGINRIWMQPGAESEQAINFCRERGIKVVYNACAMLRKRSWIQS